MIPSRPTLTATDTALDATLAVFALGALVLLVWSVVDARRRRTWVPLLALLGGAIALPIEPFWDVNVAFTFATNSSPVAFTAFGRDIPLYLACIYPAFIGWGSYMIYRLVQDGATVRTLLLFSGAFFPLDALIEIAGQQIDVWTYYGPQAWDPAGWPMYFGVLNESITVIGGTLLVVLDRLLRGPGRVVALALAVPTAYVGVYAIAGWPTWAALNADVPAVVVWVAGAVTMAIAVTIGTACARYVGAPSPVREPRAVAAPA